MKTILIIEDEEPLRLLIGELLQRAGYKVLPASSGRQGLRLARAHLPDLVLCDVRMPEMDGHAVLEELRRIPELKLTPVIIMTAHAELVDMRRSMNLGADDYVAKPFDNAELLGAVSRHLERVEQRRQEAGREFDSFRRHLGHLLPTSFVTPLHDIIGCASVLAVDAAVMPSVEIRDFAQSIHQAAERLHRQIENFMVFTQLDAPAERPTAGPTIALSPVVRTLCESIARRHRRSDSLRLELADVQAALPREHFAKAVSEVVDNAFRHTPSSSPVEVTLEQLPEGGIRLTVTDHGCGLPGSEKSWAAQKNLPKPVATHSESGAGLGLYVSRHLTELIEGRWTVKSTPTGTSVIFEFAA